MIQIPKIRQFNQATTIEDILCLATLIAVGRLPEDSEVADAIGYYDSLPVEDGCEACPFHLKCLAYIIGE